MPTRPEATERGEYGARSGRAAVTGTAAWAAAVVVLAELFGIQSVSALGVPDASRTP